MRSNREYDYFGNVLEYEYDYFASYSSTSTQKVLEYEYTSTISTPSLIYIYYMHVKEFGTYTIINSLSGRHRIDLKLAAGIKLVCLSAHMFCT